MRRPWPVRPVLLAASTALALTFLLYTVLRPAPETVTPPSAGFTLTPLAFDELAGWSDDDHAATLRAFRRSCARMQRHDDAVPMGRQEAMGRIGDWRPACAAAASVAPPEAGAFFETWFRPHRVDGEDGETGLFTGYYEPLLHGSLRPDARFARPLRRPPDDMVRVDLGLWSEDLTGREVKGRLKGDRLVPYWSRGEIERGALDGRNLELLWIDDPVDKFFLQIQGSGIVELPDGERVRVGYAGQNGRAYRAVGRDLIEMNEVPRERMSMQAIRAWLEANPDRAEDLMDKNPSYVFFRVLDDPGAGPLGAQGVPLEPGRSLAVDRAFIPLGAPLWLETALPPEAGGGDLRRLMVAQDTGGAIKGAVRGDVFWGAGPLAETVAGHMKSPGRYYILLPKGLTPTG